MLKLWVVYKDTPLKFISNQEIKWSQELSNLRKREYIHSRSYIRYLISFLVEIDPRKIPLHAPPSQPIKFLDDKFGFLSISHCKDCLLIAWSKIPIGVDVENINRSKNIKKITRKFVNISENYLLDNDENSNFYPIKLWTVKEAAVKWKSSQNKNFLNDWICNFKDNNVLNFKTNERASFYSFKFIDWQIAIVSKNFSNIDLPIICLVKN
tara:strand:- start:29938 stop:30567 length:630 start_codon:yes stop_codon:yes gene_type:complete